MLSLLKFFYSYTIIPCLWVMLRILGGWNSKIRRAIRGRDNLFETLQQQLTRTTQGKRVWFHSSSMGEFEQSKPIIAELKRRHPDVKVIITFFSPSGYDHSKKYQLADVISYIPFDTKGAARRFISLVRPDVAVMVRYDLWPNHIWELQRQGIPILIANATLREHSTRGLPIVRMFHHYLYNCIDAILTVSVRDVHSFRRFALNHPLIEAIGDTRYDQVTIRSVEAGKRHIIPPKILEGKKVIVVGSSWPEDEEVVIPTFLKLLGTGRDLLLILVPHEPTIDHIEDLENDLSGKAAFIRFSGLNEYKGESVIIVDSIGILLTLYAYADIAFVGGSFRQGVHNVLEAAVYGVPVVFGYRHRNSEEPLALVERGGGFIVHDSDELHRALANLLDNEMACTSAGERAAKFVLNNVGATDRFLQHLEAYLYNKA